MYNYIMYLQDTILKTKIIITKNPIVSLILILTLIITLITVVILILLSTKRCACSNKPLDIHLAEEKFDLNISNSPLRNEIEGYRPQKELLSIIGPKTPTLKEVSFFVNGNPFTIRLEIQNSHPLFEKLRVVIDHISMLEFALTNSIKAIYGDAKFETDYRDILIKIRYPIDDNVYFAGAFVNFENPSSITTNFDFISKIYEQLPNDYEFFKYYIGLFVHEFTHLMLPSQVPFIEPNRVRITENICEYARLVSGFRTSGWSFTVTNKELPTESYGAEGAYFIYYLKKTYPEFLSKIIKEFFTTQRTFDDILLQYTNKNQKQLWYDFLKAI